MSKMWLLASVSALSSALSMACMGGEESDSSADDAETTAEVRAGLPVVPDDVKCVRISVTGSGYTRTFMLDVSGGASPTFNLGRLPTGPAQIQAVAFNLACSAVTPRLVPAWQSEIVNETFDVGAAPSIELVLRENRERQTGVNFRPSVRSVFRVAGSNFALTDDDALWAWGNNENGQLGTGSATSGGQLTPVQIPLGGVVELTGGVGFTCALSTIETVHCWGENGHGQLGDGSFLSRLVVVPVPGLTAVKELSARRGHVCAVTAQPTAFATQWLNCWGQNDFGQLGDGTTTDRNLPTPVALPSGFGGVIETCAGDEFSCARRYTGEVLCWGRNDRGQLGDGTTTSRTLPGVTLRTTSFVALPNATSIACGARHACAIRPNGSVQCWGANEQGQLGDGTRIDRNTPVASLASGATKLALGSDATCALRGGDVLCWGGNAFGQLGDGTGEARLAPGSITLSGVTAFDGGGLHSCAETRQGLMCWGINTFGQLGDGTREPRFVPTPVAW